MKKLLLAVLSCTMLCLGADSNWQKVLAERLPAYGHRNWIVIADSAYPAQAKDGIETIVADADQLQVLQVVLNALSHSKHVAPIIHLDQELQYLDDSEAPGVDAYRTQLNEIFKDRKVERAAHEKIIDQLDQVSRTFRVLVIKTNMTVPYTTVFLQLDCAYWGPDAEKGLRVRMAAAGVR